MRTRASCVLASCTVIGAMCAMLASCCGGSPSRTCSATIRYKGKSYSANSDASDAKSEARRLACRAHCRTDDPAVEAAYQKWKSTPEGVRSQAPRDLAVESGEALRAVNECQGTCIAEMVLHPELVQTNCR